MAYDVKFKEKVLEILAQNNGNVLKTSKLLNLNYRTIVRWKETAARGESLIHKSGGKRVEKINPEKLKEYVDKNPDKYLHELAKEFNCSKTGIVVPLQNNTSLASPRRIRHTVFGSLPCLILN